MIPGLMNVAAAFGVRQVAVFGSSSLLHTPPLNAQARVRCGSKPRPATSRRWTSALLWPANARWATPAACGHHARAGAAKFIAPSPFDLRAGALFGQKRPPEGGL